MVKELSRIKNSFISPFATATDSATQIFIADFILLLSCLDPDRDIGNQQCQLSTQLLTGPVVANQTRFCLDSCTAFPQFGSTSCRVFPFFSQYHSEDYIP